jgi:hypothetical protein
MPTLDEQIAAIRQRLEASSEPLQTDEDDSETPLRPTRRIEKSETWKLRKPHPYWRPELSSDEQRQAAWLELSQDDRIYLSDNLGRRN